MRESNLAKDNHARAYGALGPSGPATIAADGLRRRRSLAHLIGSSLAFVGGLYFRRLGTIGVLDSFALIGNAFAPISLSDAFVPVGVSDAFVPVVPVPVTTTAAMMFPIADMALTILAARTAIRRLRLGSFPAALLSMLPRSATTIGLLARLGTRRRGLHLGGHDDAIVMLGVLEIALSRYDVAGGQGVARQRHVLLSDMRSGAADLHVRPVRLVTP